MNKSLLNHPFVSFEKKDGYIPVNNPATGEILAYVYDVKENELKEIIKKSQIAQKNYANKLALQRADILMKWYYLMLENQKDLAEILTLEQGKPLSESIGEISYAASFLRWFAEEARRIDGDIIQPKAHNEKLLVLKQPIGVCGAITPWNFPSAMITRKTGPALACGCSMVLKPATQTPLSAYALLVLALQAGLDEDVLSVVTGNSSMIGDVMCESDIIKKITFTGSTEIGRVLMKKSSSNIKKLSLELGGNAPFIVFDDADIQQSVQGILASKFRNSGQTCVCANRIYIQKGIYQEITHELQNAVKKLQVGNGMSPQTTQGPLIDSKAVLKVEEHINDALGKGGKVICGGKKLEGTFFEPTIITGVTSEMKVSREETFGPLAPLFEFESEEEIIQKANNTEFGLACYFYTKDMGRIWRVSEALEYGIVGINTGIISTEVAPFGGVKQSGLGREGSKYGIEDYLELKYVCLNLPS